MKINKEYGPAIALIGAIAISYYVVPYLVKDVQDTIYKMEMKNDYQIRNKNRRYLDRKG